MRPPADRNQLPTQLQLVQQEFRFCLIGRGTVWVGLSLDDPRLAQGAFRTGLLLRMDDVDSSIRLNVFRVAPRAHVIATTTPNVDPFCPMLPAAIIIYELLLWH